MPKKPREMEKIILADGWVFLSQAGSHQNPVRLQSLFIVRTYRREPKTPF